MDTIAAGAATSPTVSTGLAAAVAAASAAADIVDRQARFPIEAVDAMRAGHLLSCSLPLTLGGKSTSVTELAGMARALGAACSSAGMVFAMHHTQALTLTHHCTEGEMAELAAEVAAAEALLASATTELTTGGDVRSSTCAVVADGERIVLEKNAPVISYAEYADYIFTTARRGPDSPPNDQVLVVCPASDTTLQRTGSWDVLGFRGTCSPGYVLTARTRRRQVVQTDYSKISEYTMLPASHILWASVWLGIADAAFTKARSAVRKNVRKGASSGVQTQSAKLAELTVLHQRFESVVVREITRYEALLGSTETEPTVGFTIAMNNLKLMSSTAVVDVVVGALQLIGINAYREDHESSLGRLLRDCFAPQLMVSNDRIRANNAQLSMAYRTQQGEI